MFKILNRIIKVGDKVFVSLAIVLMIVLVLTITVGIAARYFFRMPFDWTEEVAILLFIWISFLAAAVAAARNKFVVVDYFLNKIPPSTQTIIGIITDSLTLIFLIMVIIGAVILLPQMLTHASVALDIPRTVYYVPVLISSALIFVVQLKSLLQRFDSLKRKSGKQEVSP